MGPNPKHIVQAILLLAGVFIFAVVVVFVKVRSGRSFKKILSGHKRLFKFSFGAAVILVVVGLVVFLVLKN